jgi:DNA-directed RNA polymerase specialized sigma24 family protein
MHDELQTHRLAGEFEHLYEIHGARIYRVIRAIVLDAGAAEDLTRRTFERAFREQQNGARAGSARLALHRVAVETAISYARRQNLTGLMLRRLRARAKGAAAEPVAPPSLATRALRALSPELRAAAVLHLSGGMTCDEMAAVLGTRPSVLDSRIGTAMRMMERALKGTDGQHGNAGG